MAALNDLVRHQNACEDKKLKFKLSQLENLKSTYSRQKEKEQMYFAVQHMTVPIRTDPVIYKFRKEMEENAEEYECELQGGGGGGKMKSKPMESLLDSAPGIGTSRRHHKPQEGSELLDGVDVGVIKTEKRFLYQRDKLRKFENVEEEDEESEEEGTFFTAIDSSVDPNHEIPGKNSTKNNSQKTGSSQSLEKPITQPTNIQFSRRIVSPYPGQRKNNLKLQENDENTSNKRVISTQYEITPIIRNSGVTIENNIKNKKASLTTQKLSKKITTAKPLSQRNTNRTASVTATTKQPLKSGEKPEKQVKAMHSERKMSRRFSWNKCTSPQSKQGRKYTAPRLNDLPPVGINIYEVPCNEKEAREKWKAIMENIRDSTIKDQRSENEINHENREIRMQWQTRYKEMKKNRLAAATREDLKLAQGEHLTLVKFLPKSRQSQFIKEKSLYR